MNKDYDRYPTYVIIVRGTETSKAKRDGKVKTEIWASIMDLIKSRSKLQVKNPWNRKRKSHE